MRLRGKSATLWHQSNQSGIGIVEVMITLVVIALGLVALASFQGRLISDTRESQQYSQIRSECEARLHTYSMRPMTLLDFDAIATTEWTLSNGKTGTITPSVSGNEVSLVAACPGADGEPTITLSTVTAFNNAATAILGSKQASLGEDSALSAISPSLNAGSSDDISERILIDESVKNIDGTDLTSDLQAGDWVKDADGNYYVVDDSLLTASSYALCTEVGATPFENGLYAKRGARDDPNDFYKVYLYKALIYSATEVRCTPKVRYNGGVIIPISGVIHAGKNSQEQKTLDVDLFTFNITESGTYCVYEPETGASSAPYTCYVGGNCNKNLDNVADENDTDNFKKCPTLEESDATQIAVEDAALDILNDPYDGVGTGGWRGKVGLLNIASFNGGDNVCFGEELDDLADVPESLRTRDTARNYLTRYEYTEDGIARVRAQGINAAYTCQDLVVISGVASGTDYEGFQTECKAQATPIAGLQLATKSIERNLSFPTDNKYIAPPDSNSGDFEEFTQYCGTTSYATITGTLYNPVGLPYVFATGQLGKYECTVAPGTVDVVSGDSVDYTCTIDSRETNVSITAAQNSTLYPSGLGEGDPAELLCSSVSANDDPNFCTFSFPDEGSDPYVIAGQIDGGATGTDALEGLTIHDSEGYEYGCTIYDESYLCEFLSKSGLLELHADPNIVHTATISGSNAVDINSSMGPTVTVNSKQSWTVRGSIDGDSTEGKTIAINATGDSFCTVDSNISYACYFTYSDANPSNISITFSLQTTSSSAAACTSPSKGQAKTIDIIPSSTSTYTVVDADNDTDDGDMTLLIGELKDDVTVKISLNATNKNCGN